MIEQYLFFNSTFGDRRRYSAADIAKYWRSFVSSGLIHADGEPTLRVTANGEDMTVDLDDGKAIVFGHLYTKFGDLPFTLSPSSATEDRFDRIVLRLDNTRGDDDSRFIRAFLKEGTVDGPPELERTFIEDTPIVYELSLAQIHVKAGKSFIEQSDIIDERLDEQLCGLASSLVTVPTDIFTQEWKEFVAEYNKWFANLQGSAFATVDDVRSSENNMKREIANLNLQIEANKRVKNGVTFGTNFADSFGMEIDMARTSSDEALTIGQTVITVRDASDFKAGTEVTIFDDVNLERKNIESVDGNEITLESGLTKPFKKGVNIARSMTVQRKLSNAMVFGAWGSYEYKELDYLIPWRTADRVGHEASFASIQDKWFFIAGKKLYSLGMNESEPVLIRDDFYAAYPVIISDDKFIYVAGLDADYVMSIRTYNYEGVEVSRIDYPYATANQYLKIGIDKENKHLYLLTGFEGSAGSPNGTFKVFRKYQYDNSGTLTLLKEYNHHPLDRGDYSVSNGLLSFRFDDEGNMYSIAERRRTDQYELLIVKYNRDLTSHSIIPLWSTFKREVITNCQLYQDTTGVYRVVAGTRSNVYVYSSEDLSTFSPTSEEKVFSYGGSPYATLDNMLYIVGASVITKWDFVNSEPTTIKTFSADEKLAIVNPVAFIPDYDFTGDIPIFLSANTQLGIFGKGELGYGAPLLINDIRFKVKPSKEVVTWLQHDEGLTVTEATFGNINLDLSTLDDETQAVGYTTKEQDEVRLTIERDSIDDDVKAYRILGGTS